MASIMRDQADGARLWNGHYSNFLPEYRSIDGSDNNLLNELFNPVAGSEEVRFSDLNFARGTINGLVHAPNPRTISNIVSGGPQAELHDADHRSGWTYVFGQFVDHDLDLTNPVGVDISIKIPKGDPDLADGTTIPMTRANVSASGYAINSVTGWVDGSQVYGSDPATAANLRLANGHMKTSAGNNLPIENGVFIGGDVRVMENPELTGTTMLFVREHNFQVDRLHALHPNWSGDKLYDMAKAITTGELQNIVYTEFLPAIIGNALPTYPGYNPGADPRITQEFSFGAFRFGHSTVSDAQTKIDNQGNVLSVQTLAESFTNTPADDTSTGGLDALLRNLGSDTAQAMDVYAVDGLRNFLNAPPAAIDLIAIDIQRARDVGLGTLNQTRVALGLDPYTSFSQVTSDPTVAANLQSVYGTVSKLELFIGGLAENAVGNSSMGGTFTAIIAKQFESLRDGDRHWWQNEKFDDSTKTMIGNTTLSDLIMRNTDTKDMQQNAFIAAERHLSNVTAKDPTAPQLVIGTDAAGAVIAGGPADDTLVAGLGANQILIGGTGDNLFIFDDSGHHATISDFNFTFDHIEFHGDASDAIARIHNVSSGAEISFNGNVILLTNVNAQDVSQSNFLYLDNNAFTTQHDLVKT